MKKLILLFALSFVSMSFFAQKKKSVASTAATISLAKVDNVVAEVKSGIFQIIIEGKDAIVVKPVDSKFSPIDCKLTSFKAGGSVLYLLTWTEKIQNKTDLKTEDIVAVYSNIYELTSKKVVFENKQLTNKITEKVFLDKLKQASEKQQKIRREGFEFKLNPDGTISQKNKTQESKFVYDNSKKEFVFKKK